MFFSASQILNNIFCELNKFQSLLKNNVQPPDRKTTNVKSEEQNQSNPDKVFFAKNDDDYEIRHKTDIKASAYL